MSQNEQDIRKKYAHLDIPENLPKHVAIIPDGNRRWAKRNNLPKLQGHKKGLETVTQLSKDMRGIGIKYVTFWFFSTENWKREVKEVNYLMELAYGRFNKIAKEFIKDEVRFRHLGRKDRIPEKLAKKFTELEEETKDFDRYYANLAFDYGGRDEIVRAVRNIMKDGRDIDEIDEDLIGKYLYTAGLPDPDLIIRTSGEQRLSGYLPWQGVYSELYFAEVDCPDFTIEEFTKALQFYAKRDRRMGGNSKVSS